MKDKVTTVESSDGTISVTDKNDPTSATYDAAKGHQYDIKINNQGVVNNAQIPVVYTKQDGTKVTNNQMALSTQLKMVLVLS